MALLGLEDVLGRVGVGGSARRNDGDAASSLDELGQHRTNAPQSPPAPQALAMSSTVAAPAWMTVEIVRSETARQRQTITTASGRRSTRGGSAVCRTSAAVASAA
jgi:hypothetical protein